MLQTGAVLRLEERTVRSQRGNAVSLVSCTIVSPHPIAVRRVPAGRGSSGLAAGRGRDSLA